MTHEEARARLSALLDEALPAGETVRVRAHIDTCAACAAALEELRATVAMVGGVEPVAAPEGFADRVRARLAALPQPRTMRVWDALRWTPRLRLSWRAAAAVAAAALIGVFGLNLARQLVPGARPDLAEELQPALRGTPIPGAGPAPAPGLPSLRQVIRTGQLTLEVERFDEAARRLLRIAEGAGGFVAESTTSEQGGARRGTYVLRIPAAHFGEVLQQVEGLGTVQRRQVSGQDVSEEFVDLEARIRNLERQEARLLSFMDRATRITDLMAIEHEVARVRGEIERLTGRRRLLANRVELATVHAELIERPTPAPGGFWDPGRAIARVQSAFLATVRQLLDAVETVAAVAAGLLPLALLAGGVWAVVRRAGGRARVAV